MGRKIISAIEVITEPREQQKAKIIIEVTNFSYNPTMVGQEYALTIKDSIDTEISSNAAPMQNNMQGFVGGFPKSKTIYKTKEEFDELLKSSTSFDEASYSSYSDRVDDVLTDVLLSITVSELTDGKTIYGLLPSQWSIA